MMRANRSKERFLSVDTLGLVLRVLVTAARWENEGGKQVLKRVEQMHKMCRLTTIWVDGGFDGVPFMQWVMDVRSCRLCCDRSKPCAVSKRWVVERTFGWLMGCRRLVRDYELLPETEETFIYLAMIRIMVRRLA